jgi:hypothetical protein
LSRIQEKIKDPQIFLKSIKIISNIYTNLIIYQMKNENDAAENIKLNNIIFIK